MNTNSLIRGLLAALLVVATAGCNTFHPKLDYTKTSVPGIKPHPMQANLVLPQGLSDYKIVTKLHSGSEAYEFPVGKLLYQYAQDVAKDCFQSVQLSAEHSTPSSGLVLSMKLIKASHVMPLFHDQEMTFVVEWTATDSASGKTILLTTVKGGATATMRGFNLGSGAAKCIQLALADLYKNTAAALAGSSAIEQIATTGQQ